MRFLRPLVEKTRRENIRDERNLKVPPKMGIARETNVTIISYTHSNHAQGVELPEEADREGAGRDGRTNSKQLCFGTRNKGPKSWQEE
jgi:hypothetical protein